MFRRFLWFSLVLAPIVIVLDRLGVGDVTLFIVAAAALIPLAWLIGEATEHAAHHTGPGIGGFINATFGNAPELIIALFAVADGLTEVVLRLADGKRDREPPARPRLLARVRRPRQSRSLVRASSPSRSSVSPWHCS